MGGRLVATLQKCWNFKVNMYSVQVDAEPSRPDLFTVSDPAVWVLTALFPNVQELAGLCRETCHRGSTLNST